MGVFNKLFGKKAYNNTNIGGPIPVAPEVYKPDGKFYFYIAAISNGKEIKLDILRTENSENGLRLQLGLQDIKYDSASLTSIALIDVLLPYNFVSGSISVKYNGSEYSAANLFGSHETRLLDASIDLYNEPIKSGSINYYARYQDENIWLNRCTNEENFNSSSADYLRITHTLKNNVIEFYIDGEKNAQICPQIYPCEPRYEGWILDGYRPIIPFLTVRLVVDWFQY